MEASPKIGAPFELPETSDVCRPTPHELTAIANMLLSYSYTKPSEDETNKKKTKPSTGKTGSKDEAVKVPNYRKQKPLEH